MKISRRHLLFASVTALGSLGLSRFAGKSMFGTKPITGQLLGASNGLGHRLMSDHFPEPTNIIQKDLVIIGAGIAGLGAGYRLAKVGFQNFVLLDLEKQPGGNASNGQNAVSAYPWGAHYVPLVTDDARAVRRLFEELGIITGYSEVGLPIYNEFYICQDPNERLFRLGRWQEGLVPTLGVSAEDETQYRRFFALLADFKKRKGIDGKRLFAIPVAQSSQDPQWLALDQLSMEQWLDDQGFSSEPLRWYVNYCCRDDFGSTLQTTSAWAGIHYFASRSGQAANTDADSVITWPAGNGWLAAALAKPIQANIITQALCYKVQDHGNRVTVDYWDAAAQQSVRIEAKAAIMATPRFVAARLLQSPGFALNAKGFSYSPWVVANITLSKMPTGKGVALSWDNVVYGSELLGYVTATHQITQMRPIATVLTYYWPLSHLPPALARAEALQRNYEQWQALFLRELLRLHPELEGFIEHVDVWLWGHGMICPTPNFIWGATRKAALKQHPPVFFAHSDMSGISIFEEAYSHGVSAAEQLLSFLNITYQSEL